MKYTYTKTEEKTIDILDIYPQEKLDEIQKEWEIVEFRVPKNGDTYLIKNMAYPARAEIYAFDFSFPSDQPRAILKKKPKCEKVGNKTCYFTVQDVYGVEEIELPLGWKYKDFRIPKYGENYLNAATPSSILFCDYHEYMYGPRIIVERS